MMRDSDGVALWYKIVGGVFYALFCVTVMAAGAGLGWVAQSPALSSYIGLPFGGPAEKPNFSTNESLTVLILGCDSDLSPGGKKVINQHARSDMMMVAKLDFPNKSVSGLTIPRDTLVALPGYRLQKINGYHAAGGPDLSRRAVEHLLPGLIIDRVIVLDFDAFQEMVDAAGGVEVYVPKRMRYNDRVAGLKIDLQPGRQHLDGYEAMGYVRYRKTDSDIVRQERQRDFMLAFKQAVIQNPTRLPHVVNHAARVVGDGLNAAEVALIARFLQEIDSEQVKMDGLPVVDAPNRVDLLVNERELPIKLKELNLIDSTRLTLRR
jgi:polyisoprenyl-teichoic acid--peptidoglycan teichoic acid transferase